MGPFIGFLVLLGPLVFVALWLPICLWIARKVAKRFTGGGARWASGVAAFLVVFLLPFADSIAGRIYFNHLCSTEAGVKVYQTVELPAEYWDEQGKAKFYVGWDSHLGKKYPLLYEQGTYSSGFYIDNAGYKFVDKQSGQVLGEIVDFRYWGGWIARNFSPHNSATTCEFSDNLINKIFKPSK